MDGPSAPQLYDQLLGVSIMLGICFVLGLWYRVLAPIFGGLLLWVLTYGTSWSMIFHTENMLTVHVLILSVAPAASALSLDANLTQERPVLQRFGFSPTATAPHYRFSWPIRCLQLGATLPYVLAGLAKVRGEMGWSWALGENLRDQITMNGLYYDVLKGGAKEVTYHVYDWQFGVLFMFAATTTLILELLAPLALLNRYVGYAYVAGIMGMHWGILWLMGIPFTYQLWGFAYVCFIEWDLLLAWIGRRLPQSAKEWLLAG
jgi:hypothetical protein